MVNDTLCLSLKSYWIADIVGQPCKMAKDTALQWISIREPQLVRAGRDLNALWAKRPTSVDLCQCHGNSSALPWVDSYDTSCIICDVRCDFQVGRFRRHPRSRSLIILSPSIPSFNKKPTQQIVPQPALWIEVRDHVIVVSTGRSPTFLDSLKDHSWALFGPCIQMWYPVGVWYWAEHNLSTITTSEWGAWRDTD
jgi:hypothetical protein